MGTNYKALYKVCPHCDKPDRVVHIGKSSHGWPFLFRAYPPKHYDWEPGEFPKDTIVDAEDWRQVLSHVDVLIQDEYGRSISEEDFWERVEATKGYCPEHTPSEREYTDPQGYKFFLTEFS